MAKTKGTTEDTWRAMLALFAALTAKNGSKPNMTEICREHGVGTDTPAVMLKLGYLEGDPNKRARTWAADKGAPTMEDAERVRSFRSQIQKAAREKPGEKPRVRVAPAGTTEPQAALPFPTDNERRLEERVERLERIIEGLGVTGRAA